jgi:hypothetical protein
LKKIDSDELYQVQELKEKFEKDDIANTDGIVQ